VTSTRRRTRRVLAAVGAALWLVACAGPRSDVARSVTSAWEHPEQTPLGQAYAPRLAARSGSSGAFALTSGMDALAVRAGLADAAQHTLDLQYYILHGDTTSQILLARVLRAAERGVRVRVLVDDLDAVGKDEELATLAAFSNVEVRLFNPFESRGAFGLLHLLELALDPRRLNRRMHNKLWIADNALAVVGGRNLGDEYFDASGEVNFADLDLLAAGPLVPEVSRSFDAYWTSDWAVPIWAFVGKRPGAAQREAFAAALQAQLEGFRETPYAGAVRDSGIVARLRAGELPLAIAPARAFYDPPSKVAGEVPEGPTPPIFAAYIRPVLDGAKDELILISPYFIPSERGIELMRTARQRGVRVRILTNSLASSEAVPIAFAGYARLRQRLLEIGVELHEMRPESYVAARAKRLGRSSGAHLHTKAIIIDRRHVVLGSMNLDPRSRLSNTEVGVLVASEELAAQLAGHFEAAVAPGRAFRVTLSSPGDSASPLVWTGEEDGVEVRHDGEPGTGPWRRFVAAILRLVAPEELL
jgi:putative cardiolipin synthase